MRPKSVSIHRRLLFGSMSAGRMTKLGLLATVSVLLLGLGGCASKPDATKPTLVERYFAGADLPQVLMLVVTGGEAETATAQVLSQDGTKVVVSAQLHMDLDARANGTAVGYPVYAVVVLDAPLRGRTVEDVSGYEVPKYHP